MLAIYAEKRNRVFHKSTATLDAFDMKKTKIVIAGGGFANPADIGDACVFLSSALAEYVSGANLAVHGGGEPPPYLDVSAL